MLVQPSAPFDIAWNRALRKLIRKMYLRPRFKGRYYVMLVLKKMYQTPRHPVIIQLDHNLEIEVNPFLDKGVESALFYSGIYESGTLHFIESRLNVGDDYIDVGANIGLMTLYAARKIGPTGKVLAIEPNPETRAILERNVTRNGLTNVLICADAVGGEGGSARIYANWNINRGGASLINRSTEENGVDVRVSPLDDLVAQFGLQPSMIKIDVEGFELQVLQGARKLLQQNDLPILIMEISRNRTTQGGDFHDIVSMLRSTGKYRFFLNKGSKESRGALIEILSDDDFPEHDNVYCVAH